MVPWIVISVYQYVARVITVNKTVLHPLDPRIKGLFSCCRVLFRPSSTLFVFSASAEGSLVYPASHPFSG